MRKIGITFHETLKLRRSNLSQALECIENGVTDQEEIYKQTSLGANEAKTVLNFLRACGLLNWEKELTPFGKTVLKYDRSFSSISTQWIFHYFLCAPHGLAPGFWGHIVTRHFLPGDTVSSEVAISTIKEYLDSSDQKMVNEGTLQSTVNVFFKAYNESDGLGNLNILEDNQTQPQSYTVAEPEEIPWRVMAYLLADFWEANWGQTLSIPHAQINADEGPAPLMLLNSGQMNQLMKSMQEAGILEISRVSRPWTVLRKWTNKEELLEAVYTDESC